MAINQLSLSLIKRNVPYRGPRTSDSWNDTIDEIASDLAAITSEWNNKLHPLLASIPDGTDDVNVDAFLNGLDGKQLYTDQNATDTSDNGELWSTAYSRPLTIKETIDSMKDEIESNYNDLATLVSDTAGILTHDQKRAIGLEIFDEDYTFTGISLLTRSQTNEYNVSQIAKDLYGTSSVLDGDGISHFGVGGAGASVNDALTAILAMHGGTWSTDVSLVHSIVNADVNVSADIVQTKLYKSDAGASDTFTIGEDPVNLLGDLNMIRTVIKLLKGTSGWTVTPDEPYVGAPVTLNGHVNNTGNPSYASDSNPHGLDFEDLGGNALSNIRTVLGIDASDTMPPYEDFPPEGTALTYILSTDSVTAALAKLDESLAAASASSGAHAILTNNPHSVTAAQITHAAIAAEINANSSLIDWNNIGIDGDGLITTVNSASTGTINWARLAISGDNIVTEVNDNAVSLFDWNTINIDGDGLVTDINTSSSVIDWNNININGDGLITDINSSSSAIDWAKLTITSANIATLVNAGAETLDWDNINTAGSNLIDLATRSHTDLTDIGTRTHSAIDTALDILETINHENFIEEGDSRLIDARTPLSHGNTEHSIDFNSVYAFDAHKAGYTASLSGGAVQPTTGEHYATDIEVEDFYDEFDEATVEMVLHEINVKLDVIGSQQSAISSLTDSTGGTTDGTLSAVSGSGDDSTINNNIAELHTKLDLILVAMRNHGLIVT